jgi:integrase/recombinase XerC
MAVFLPAALPDPTSLPVPSHGLGNVADDWEAAEVWLQAIGSRPKKGSPQTVATYRHRVFYVPWRVAGVGALRARWDSLREPG